MWQNHILHDQYGSKIVWNFLSTLLSMLISLKHVTEAFNQFIAVAVLNSSSATSCAMSSAMTINNQHDPRRKLKKCMFTHKSQRWSSKQIEVSSIQIREFLIITHWWKKGIWSPKKLWFIVKREWADQIELFNGIPCDFKCTAFALHHID